MGQRCVFGQNWRFQNGTDFCLIQGTVFIHNFPEPWNITVIGIREVEGQLERTRSWKVMTCKVQHEIGKIEIEKFVAKLES